jgi:eukaryotic-like serine/threonine-protein kinase
MGKTAGSSLAPAGVESSDQPMQDDGQEARIELPVQIGELIDGKYRVTDTIAFGGMGVVLGAIHVDLETPVAIKFVRPELLHEESLVLRFLNEARSAAKLKSEHIARVMDSGRLPSGMPYLVLERLEGSDLGSVIRKHGPLPIPVAVDYVLQACAGLLEAHGLEIVHRDIKPENLFLTKRADNTPLVKILDFGISKQLSGGPPSSLTIGSSGSLGSPNYMSPEQMEAPQDVDARADIWSLGVVLFELVSGTCPFQGGAIAETCAQVLTAPTPSLRARRADVPPELDAIVQQCLVKQRDGRFPNVSQLTAALEPFSKAVRPVLRARAVRATDPVAPVAPGALRPPVNLGRVSIRSSRRRWVKPCGLVFGLTAIGAMTIAGAEYEIVDASTQANAALSVLQSLRKLATP